MPHFLVTAVVSLATAALAASARAAPSYSVTGHIKADDGGWDYASFDPVHGRLFVSRSAGVVTVVDVATMAVTAFTHPRIGPVAREPAAEPWEPAAGDRRHGQHRPPDRRGDRRPRSPMCRPASSRMRPLSTPPAAWR